MALEQLKRELELFGEQNDGAQQSRGSKMLNITRDTGELLAVLVQTRGPMRCWRSAPPTVTPPSGWPRQSNGWGPGHHHRAGRRQTGHGGSQLSAGRARPLD